MKIVIIAKGNVENTLDSVKMLKAGNVKHEIKGDKISFTILYDNANIVTRELLKRNMKLTIKNIS